MPKFSGLCLLLLLMILVGCTPAQAAPLDPPTATVAALPGMTPSVTPTPIPTPTPAPHPTATPTAPPTLIPTATLVSVEAGSPVVVPVLLYHHIANNISDIRYFVAPSDFRTQMDTLKKLGYSTISVSKMVDIIKKGGELPARPVVITFDDGAEDVYQNAFPIMKDMGMTGALYIVANRLGIQDFLSVSEIKEMMSAGWEVGSHSTSHTDLRQVDNLSYEMYNSRLRLSSALGTPIQTFAYPFGATEEFISRKAKTYGYEAAMGLGKSYTHTTATLFYIDRLEVRHSTTMAMFLDMLPWKTP
jgi:peptidoglycan/xylan/chitin deacetylase (PgdA/CDA1 family)